jgi:hypothetical protein
MPEAPPLEPLIGNWVLGDPSAPVGKASFEWLDGGFFVIQRWEVDITEAPNGIAILGDDPVTGELVQHYYDSRGVARVYGMSLEHGVWKLWRDGDDFSQRFTATIDGDTIAGAWEIALDGKTWEHDFDLVFTRAE